MKSISKLNLPNKLTLARVMGLFFIVLIYFLPLNSVVFEIKNIAFSLKRMLIFILFILSAITDALDGKIARSRNLITTFGKFLDPIADKLLVNTLFLLLAFSDEVHLLVPIIFIARDTIVDAIRLLMIEKQVVIAASSLGKLKTVFQMLALVFLLIYNLPFVLINIPFATILTYIALFFSIVSGFDYLYKNKSFLLDGNDNEK